MICFDFTGKVDFLQELEKNETSYAAFNNVYHKLKTLWNLMSRSANVYGVITEICKSSLVSPGATRWNSEYDAMNDVYLKREKVEYLHF